MKGQRRCKLINYKKNNCSSYEACVCLGVARSIELVSFNLSSTIEPAVKPSDSARDPKMTTLTSHVSLFKRENEIKPHFKRTCIHADRSTDRYDPVLAVEA
jgi:hypothetical protein